MYDHEYHPQEMIFENSAGVMWISMQGALEKCDGVVATTPEAFEPEGAAGFRDWLTGDGKSIHIVGPLIPISADAHAIAGEAEQSAASGEIKTFMDNVLKSHGPRSLLYISFGSMFWSKKPEKIWTFLDVVMEKKIPFIFSFASPFAVVPDDVATKVKEYGLGIFSKWSPQQTIFSHPVTGWFVSHCGQNSTLEAVVSGVPIICWPFHADQGINAAHLTVNLDVAYELFEVRTGHGLKPIYHTGKAPVNTPEALREEASDVLTKAFGEDGETKRANMKKLQEKVLTSWESGGPSEVELKRLVDSFVTA